MNELTADQHALAQYMSDLSEEAYCACWMADLEHALWCALEEGPYGYGRLTLLPRHMQRLRELSELCSGWIHFDDNGESFVPLDRWRNRLYQRERGSSNCTGESGCRRQLASWRAIAEGDDDRLRRRANDRMLGWAPGSGPSNMIAARVLRSLKLEAPHELTTSNRLMGTMYAAGNSKHRHVWPIAVSLLGSSGCDAHDAPA
jgi:hypothetical protein